MTVTRRALLAGGAAAVVTGIGGYAALRGRDSGVTWVEGRLSSPHWPGHDVSWRLARPDPARVPSPRLVVALHGRGGYGALWLGAHYGPSVVGAVATMSAALWTSPGASATGAFDDREDFLAHDVFARTTDLARMPVSLACGSSDPFIAANRALAATLPHAVTSFDAGGHDDGYWRPHGIQALEWCAATLAS